MDRNRTLRDGHDIRRGGDARQDKQEIFPESSYPRRFLLPGPAANKTKFLEDPKLQCLCGITPKTVQDE